ncbi:TrbI/VirB10 family protein [Novosphingobium sp.]|uniref:TrbI/VirB10 family protein n=1 Tax=Novosphingobium sp. TaxID=1874826 RepID=UPI003342AB61
MTNPLQPGGDPSPFVGPQAWPPSLVARKPSLALPIMGGLAVVVLGTMVFLGLNGARTTTDPGQAQVAGQVRSAMPGAGPGGSADLAASGMGQAPAVLMPGLGGTGAQAGATPFSIGQGGSAEPAGSAVMPGTMPATAPDAATQRYHGPLVVVDMGGNAAAAAGLLNANAGGAQTHTATAAEHGGQTGLSTQLGGGATSVTPSRMADTARIAPQGTIIPAVLETGINSDLPGFVRAIVGRDVRGYDGTTVLIPRGTRLIGQYRNGVAIGQSRAFVVWSRLITPAGLSVDIESPGTDSVGQSGITGETHTHFFRRFGNAILLSVLNAALQAGANSTGSGATSIVIGSQAQATNVATLALQKEIDIPPTVIVHPGTPIQVFVARDLDFTGVAEKR